MDSNQINDLINKIKNDPAPSEKSVNDFINQNLSPAQAGMLGNVLQNPQMLKELLASPQAKQLMDMLTNNKGE